MKTMANRRNPIYKSSASKGKPMKIQNSKNTKSPITYIIHLIHKWLH